MIRTEWLESFVFFAEEMSFTRGARRAHLSQPAFFMQIRRLSEELGVSLYERKGRGLVLTLQGQKLQAFGRESRQRVVEFLAHLKGDPSLARVSLAAGEGTLLYVLGPALRKLVIAREVDLRLLTKDRAGTLEAVRTGEADVGVAASEVVPEGFRSQKLYRAGMKVVMPRGHRLAKKRLLRIKDLDGESLIVPGIGSPHRQTVERACAAAGAQWRVALESGGWALMLDYAEKGMGLAIVNDICPTPRAAVARPLRDLPGIDYRLFRRAESRDTASVRLVCNAVVEAFGRLP